MLHWVLCKIGLHSWTISIPNQRRVCVGCWKAQEMTLVDLGRSKVWLAVEK